MKIIYNSDFRKPYPLCLIVDKAGLELLKDAIGKMNDECRTATLSEAVDSNIIEIQLLSGHEGDLFDALTKRRSAFWDRINLVGCALLGLVGAGLGSGVVTLLYHLVTDLAKLTIAG